MFSLTQIAAGAALVLIGLFTIGAIFARLYNRATKEKAFVRTGFGGQRVIMDGGALVFPVLHEVIPVNMNTLRLEVRRAAQGALITKDRMRVDVGVEVYVSAFSISESASSSSTRVCRTSRISSSALGVCQDGRIRRIPRRNLGCRPPPRWIQVERARKPDSHGRCRLNILIGYFLIELCTK